jgi:hypothetical protein
MPATSAGMTRKYFVPPPPRSAQSPSPAKRGRVGWAYAGSGLPLVSGRNGATQKPSTYMQEMIMAAWL